MNPRSLLPALSLFALAACGGGTTFAPGDGGGGGDGSTGEAGVSASQAAQDTAMAYCAKAQACAPAYVTYDMGDVATCQTRFSAQLLTDLGATGTSETAGQLEACAQALPQASCTDLLESNLPMPCRPLPGMLANGAPCESDGQCMGTKCSVPDSAVCGTCTTPAAAGAACGTNSDCAPKLSCVNKVCTAYAAMGASCSAAQPCEPGLGCVGGTCGAPNAAGMACTDSTQCDQLHGGFCNPMSKLCETVTFVQPGAMCGLPGGRLTLCAGPGGLCDGITAPAYLGTCKAHAADGAMCADADAGGPLCSFEAKCVNGSCQIATSTSCH